MKAITIKQPFASLIAEGLKTYEFRTWKTSYRGKILIHAGKSVDKEAMKRFENYDLEYPLGCVIAMATLTDCVMVTQELKDELRKENAPVYAGTTEDPEFNGYGLKLGNITKIAPVYTNGMLGLWNFEDESLVADLQEVV